jgi:hypothetical protein
MTKGGSRQRDPPFAFCGLPTCSSLAEAPGRTRSRLQVRFWISARPPRNIHLVSDRVDRCLSRHGTTVRRVLDGVADQAALAAGCQMRAGAPLTK